MTEKQKTKVENLEKEIRKVEDKINKLLTHRQILASQIEEIKTSKPKVQMPPTEEQRKEQSERDKMKHADLVRRNSCHIQRLTLGS